MKKLTFEDYVPIESLQEWGYIPEFKRYGPCGRFMVKAGDLVNALNRDVKLTLSEKYIGPIYVLVKEFNLLIEQTNPNNLPPASTAEDLLENILYKEEKKIQIEEQISNPLDDSSTEDDDINISRIIRSSPPTFTRKPKRDKPKLYEVVAAKKINTLEELVPKSARSTYDDIEFLID